MHIEKINDKQIKCTLTRNDLLDRELDLNELAYGSDKARELFREMIEQAHDTFGFEANNTPLMVEAIPMPRESIVLIITRIDNPDELDTRFSKFSTTDTEETEKNELDMFDDIDDFADDDDMDSFSDSEQDEKDVKMIPVEKLSDISELKNLLSELHGEVSSAEKTGEKESINTSDSDSSSNLIRFFTFGSLDTLLEVSQILHPIYNGVNSLYKDPATSTYYLAVSQSEHTMTEFNKTCNILSEYGKREKGTAAREAYYAEHYTCIVPQTALQRLYLF